MVRKKPTIVGIKVEVIFFILARIIIIKIVPSGGNKGIIFTVKVSGIKKPEIVFKKG